MNEKVAIVLRKPTSFLVDDVEILHPVNRVLFVEQTEAVRLIEIGAAVPLVVKDARSTRVVTAEQHRRVG